MYLLIISFILLLIPIVLSIIHLLLSLLIFTLGQKKELLENLKSTYQKNTNLDNTPQPDILYLTHIFNLYKQIIHKKLINKFKFSLLKTLIVEVSILLPCICIANLHFKFIAVDDMIKLLKSPFIILCLIPFFMYIKFGQPRETWSRHSHTVSLLEIEFYSFIYDIGNYSNLTCDPSKINYFENQILDIFSNNVTRFANNMKEHVKSEISLSTFKS